MNDLFDHIKENEICCVFSKKKHYGKYNYRIDFSPKDVKMASSVSFNLNGTMMKNMKKLQDKIMWLTEQHDAYVMLTDIENDMQWKVNSSFRRTNNKNNYVLLFTEWNHALEICQKYGEHVKTISCYVDSKNIPNYVENTITRDQLFFNKFRYKIKFRADAGNLVKLFPMLIKKLEHEEDHAWHIMSYPRFLMRYNALANDVFLAHKHGCSNYLNLYLKNTETYTLLKMMLSQYIMESEEVVTYDEIMIDK